MAVTESYVCDVCGKQKSASEQWWLAWVDCFPGPKPELDQPLIKLTRWQQEHAHSHGVKHLCGARCALRNGVEFQSGFHQFVFDAGMALVTVVDAVARGVAEKGKRDKGDRKGADPVPAPVDPRDCGQC
jgi:hypothetical protein